jgi:hypothetical protein
VSPSPPAVVPAPSVATPTIAPVAPSPSPVVPAPSVSPQTRNAPAAEAPRRSHAYLRHHARPHARWSRRHISFRAWRLLGPSYYPGLGVVYPPYADPCHFTRIWHGYYVGHLEVACGLW